MLNRRRGLNEAAYVSFRNVVRMLREKYLNAREFDEADLDLPNVHVEHIAAALLLTNSAVVKSFIEITNRKGYRNLFRDGFEINTDGFLEVLFSLPISYASKESTNAILSLFKGYKMKSIAMPLLAMCVLCDVDMEMFSIYEVIFNEIIKDVEQSKELPIEMLVALAIVCEYGAKRTPYYVMVYENIIVGHAKARGLYTRFVLPSILSKYLALRPAKQVLHYPLFMTAILLGKGKTFYNWLMDDMPQEYVGEFMRYKDRIEDFYAVPVSSASYIHRNRGYMRIIKEMQASLASFLDVDLSGMQDAIQQRAANENVNSFGFPFSRRGKRLLEWIERF